MPEDGATAAPRKAAPTEDLRRALDQAEVRPDASPSMVQPGQVARDPTAELTTPITDRFPACQVLAMQRGNLLLLAAMSAQTSARRLAGDLLGSMAASNSPKPIEMHFEWPPEQVPGVALDGRRALTAFISRQLDDLAAGSTVVVCEEVRELLPGLADLLAQRSLNHLAIARLRELAVSAAAKRTLWTQLQQLRQ